MNNAWNIVLEAYLLFVFKLIVHIAQPQCCHNWVCNYIFLSMCFMECPVSQLLHQPGQHFFRKHFAYQLLYVPRFPIQGGVWCASGSHLEYGVELLQKSTGMQGAQCQRNIVLPFASTITMDRVLEAQDCFLGQEQELGDQNSVSKACHEALATFNNSIKYYFSHFFLFKYA